MDGFSEFDESQRKISNCSNIIKNIVSNDECTITNSTEHEDVRIVNIVNSKQHVDNMVFNRGGFADSVKVDNATKNVTLDNRIVKIKNVNKNSQNYEMSMSMKNNDSEKQQVIKNEVWPPDDLAEAYIWAYNINASPIIVHRFKAYLKGYDKSLYDEVVDIVQNGAHIPSEIDFDESQPIPPNQKSTIEYEPLVNEMILKELAEKRIAGPFLYPPPGLIISPLGAVPKKEAGKIRIIHNLSHPLNNSVNSNIPNEFCSVEYELIDVCTELVAKLGKGTLMSKGDLHSAFRLLKVCLTDLYFDKMLPMGASVSCSQFEKLSCAIQWILINVFKVKHMSHILDDFLFFGKADSEDCKNSLQSFLLLAKSIGLKVKPEKTVWPATQVEMHGILFDSISMTLSLPPDKVQKAKSLLDALFKKRKAKLVLIQQIHGVLNFACRAVPPGRTFLRRISNLMKGMSNPNHFVRIIKEARKDFQAWIY
ncbi:MAG: hypothetical protein GY705_17490, partial [Bacteroidetes bacterium]|nr:hypothetical protein [Bacteroidota bacterium]